MVVWNLFVTNEALILFSFLSKQNEAIHEH